MLYQLILLRDKVLHLLNPHPVLDVIVDRGCVLAFQVDQSVKVLQDSDTDLLANINLYQTMVYLKELFDLIDSLRSSLHSLSSILSI